MQPSWVNITGIPARAPAAPSIDGRISAARSADATAKHDELKRASQEFEAIFLAQLLKVMRETIEESGLTEGGFGKSIYTELFDQEVALNMARRGALGIADMLYENLSAKEAGPQAGDAPAQANPAPSGGHSSSPAEEMGEDISDLQLPVRAPISSPFGWRKDPFSGRARFHKGVDLAAPEGMTVVAALPGTVISARYERGYGNTVVVEHSGGVRTRYGHLGSISVRPGDTIGAAEPLGTVGSTGRSTGPHLHFEVMR